MPSVFQAKPTLHSGLGKNGWENAKFDRMNLMRPFALDKLGSAFNSRHPPKVKQMPSLSSLHRIFPFNLCHVDDVVIYTDHHIAVLNIDL